MGARLDALQRQFTETNTAIDALEANPAGDGGDLSDEQQSQYDTLIARAEELQGQIETEAKRASARTATEAVLAKLAATTPAAQPIARADTAADGPASEISAGEFFAAFAKAQAGDTHAEKILRAVADQTTGDLSGVLPKNLTGSLIKLADSRRPLFNSFRSLPMPAKGRQFDRPRVTQRTLITEQLTEKGELDSRKMIIVPDTVTKRTFGGVLDISEQTLDWTDPAFLDIALQDFAEVYVETTEAAAVAWFEALPAADAEWDWTGVQSIVTSVTAAVQTVYNSSKRMPDTCWLALDQAMQLAAVLNEHDSVTAVAMLRQALQFVGVNLSFVIAPALTAGVKALGASSLVESYEQRKGMLSAVNVPQLGLDVAYRGYVAFNTVITGTSPNFVANALVAFEDAEDDG